MVEIDGLINIKVSVAFKIISLFIYSKIKLVIVFKNGKSAFNAEHSAMDGMLTLRLNEFILGALTNKKIELGPKQSVTSGQIKELEFKLDDKAIDYIKQAEKHRDEIMGNHTLDVSD